VNVPEYHIYPLGDHAITITMGNTIDEQINQQILSLFYTLQQQKIPFVKDLIPAYCSLTLVYDAAAILEKQSTAFSYMKQQLEQALKETANSMVSSRSIEIPVCYDLSLGIDLEEMAVTKDLSVEQLIQLHSNNTYRVFMIGFLPGFSYMGTVDERIFMPRKAQPRTKVFAGSVGIAGQQTGIYPFDSPGGWNIIGQTPVKLFDAERKEPVYLQAGDTVKFIPITLEMFHQLKAQP
jgi:inhibitor of KinA